MKQNHINARPCKSSAESSLQRDTATRIPQDTSSWLHYTLQKRGPIYEQKKSCRCLRAQSAGSYASPTADAVKNAAKAIADLVEADCQVVISHSNAPQVGMIHTAMNEFGKQHPDYTFAPMSVCSAMSQGYIGYDLQNAIREELLNRGIGPPGYHHSDSGCGKSLR